jgi:hypothetical protein
MLSWKQVTRVGLLALIVAGASLALVAVTTHPSYAQSSGSLADPGSITDPGSGPKPGDPDGPTGDLPTPTSTSGRMVPSGTGTPNTPTDGMAPERRFTVWAQLKVAFKLWLRSSFL